jgi:hypothetical protein
MENQLELNPDLSILGIKAVPILYNLAKAEEYSNKPKSTTPQPSVVPNKVRAETSPGKAKSAPLDKNNPEYWRNKTPDEIRAEIGYAPGQDNIPI